MASTFVSAAAACATSCTTKAEYTVPCLELDGELAGFAFTKCGNTLECPTDTAEVSALYDAGGLVVVHTIQGEMGEPTENIVESTINCIPDKVTHYDHPYTITMPYALTNEEWYKELDEKKFNQFWVITKEAVAHEITNIKQFLAKEFTNNGLHQVTLSITSRRSSGIKTGAFAAKYPFYDPACVE